MSCIVPNIYASGNTEITDAERWFLDRFYEVDPYTAGRSPLDEYDYPDSSQVWLTSGFEQLVRQSSVEKTIMDGLYGIGRPAAFGGPGTAKFRPLDWSAISNFKIRVKFHAFNSGSTDWTYWDGMSFKWARCTSLTNPTSSASPVNIQQWSGYTGDSVINVDDIVSVTPSEYIKKSYPCGYCYLMSTSMPNAAAHIDKLYLSIISFTTKDGKVHTPSNPNY